MSSIEDEDDALLNFVSTTSTVEPEPEPQPRTIKGQNALLNFVSTTSTVEPEPEPQPRTIKGQKWCEACQANVLSKNFSAHTKTKKHQQNLNK